LRSPTPVPDAPIVSMDSVILALRSRFDPGAAHGLRASYELRLGEDRFRIEVADDEVQAARGDADQADATIDTDADTLAAVLWGGWPLVDAQRWGSLTIEGGHGGGKALRWLFPAPEPATRASPT
jgi:putative sterol carrier protein